MLLQHMRNTFPSAEMVYKLGNHEERYESYMQVKAPEKLKVEEFRIENLLHLDDLNIAIVKDCRPIRLGKLNILHGHEYKFAIQNPVSPARGLFLRAGANTLCGHFHKSSQHSKGDLEGKIVSTWSVGSLCQMHPRFAPINDWNHGFALVNVDKSGAFQISNMRIFNGKVYA